MNLSILTAPRRAGNTISAATLAATAILVAFFAMLLAASAAYAVFDLGTNGRDRMVGTPNPDTLMAKGGNDTVIGKGSIDELSGQRGKDKVIGNDGADHMDGGSGGDVLVGGDGADNLQAASGNDTIYTGTKADGKDGDSDEVRCGGGYDVVYLSGQDHAAHNVEAKDVCEEIHNY
jgi:Ca2+-binding RTX toxin-like protein